MNTNYYKPCTQTVAAAALLTLSVAGHAAKPLWTFNALTPTSVTVAANSKATVRYTVTNQSSQPKQLQLKPMAGVSASACNLVGRGSSCILTLTIDGSAIPAAGINTGPMLCQVGNPNQCYQPSQANSLVIRLMKTPPVQQYTITASAGSNGSVSPNGAQTVNSGASLTFTATPASGYGVNQWLVDGALVQTGGATYQLVNLNANHTVNVTFGTVTLTPLATHLGSFGKLPSIFNIA